LKKPLHKETVPGTLMIAQYHTGAVRDIFLSSYLHIDVTDNP